MGNYYLACLIMKCRNFIFILIAVATTGCKTLKGLGAKDNSTIGTATKIERFGGSPVFIEDVSINPGADSKKTVQASKVKYSDSKSVVSYSNKSNASALIENAEWLQFKYAILTGIAVEQLSNLKLLQTIDSWYGTRYCMGGTTERCIDCSAFALTLMKEVYDLSLPRIAQDQYYATSRVSLYDLQQGDLVFFHTTGRYVSHVGVYIGNNKFVHASTSNGVMISDLNETYWAGKYVGAGSVHKTLEDNSFDGMH